MNAFFMGFLVSSTAIATVVLGVFGGYCAISGVLAAFGPSRPAKRLAALVPQNSVSGD